MFKKIILGFILGLLLTARAMAQGVDYYLPYPGLLPDHPLYWLKMVRDRAQLIITTNKDAKAERLLLYADKRLGAAWALIEGNKTALGVSTLTKAEKYLDQAWNEGKGTPVEERLSKAIKKHLEVARSLKDKSGEHANIVGDIIAKLEALNAQTKPIAIPVSVEVIFDTKNQADADVQAQNALEALEKISEEKNWPIEYKDYDFGKMVDSVNGSKNSPKKAWIYYVNDVAGDRAAGQYELKAGDKVKWQYEAVKP